MDDLASGPGAPHAHGMEMRVQGPEDTVSRIARLIRSNNDRLRKVEIDVAETKGRMTHLPSTWAMITTMLGGQVALAVGILTMTRMAGSR